MEQNTPEWIEMRKNKLGASDAPVVMKVSPYKTPYQLWQEKLSLVKPQEETYPQAEGKRKEPIAKAALEDKLGMPLFPSVKLHNQRSWMMASIDAMSFDQRTIAEIKCPGKVDHESALSGQVPEKYFPQLQHQMEVCEVEQNYYFSFDGNQGVLLKVQRDDKYIKQLLIEEEKFWECMNTFEPPELIDRDYVTREDERWNRLANRLKDLRELQSEEEQIKAELISLAAGQNSLGRGI